MLSINLVLVLLHLVSLHVASASTISPAYVNPANGHRYVLLNANTWTASENEAVALGGHLATVRSAAEEDWIFNTFGRHDGQARLLWIGLNDQMVSGKFTWSSAEPVGFTAWAPGEPNLAASEHFAAIFYPGHSAQNRWNNWGDRSTDPIGLPINGVVELGPDSFLPPLIAMGSLWRFMDDGVNRGTSWRERSYNHASWKTGRAQLGYGDGDETTLVGFGSNPDNKYVTTYFRHAFVVDDPSPVARLNVRMLRDDGAVVYLNGTEVYRSNMPQGTIGYRTLASSAASNGDETNHLHTMAISASLLLRGTNVVAVEVHQVAINSSDLSFDLELNALGQRPPMITVYCPVEDEVLAAPIDLPLIANATDDGQVARVEFRVDDVLIGVVTNVPHRVIWSNAPAGVHLITAVALDNAGIFATSAPVRVTLLPGLAFRGAVWRYLDAGIDQGAAWRSPDFDDSGWSEGRAKFGYGMGDETTTVSYGTNANEKHITTYFRQWFASPPGDGFTNLLLRFQHDDGAVIYLNGEEVVRGNMPPKGSINFSTLALETIINSEEAVFHEAIISSIHLRAGTNLIAVEVHQASASSTDLAWDMELLGLTAVNWPYVAIHHDGPDLRLSWSSAAAQYLLETSVTLDGTASWSTVTTPRTTNETVIETLVPGAVGSRFFRLRR